MTIQELFIKFLKLNNCYEQFIFNVNEQKDYHNCKSLDEYLNRYSYTSYTIILWWDKTKEGFYYWCELHHKWETFCKNNIKFICKLEKT